MYSLGVLLYELLTGTTPFGQDELQQAGFDEQRRVIREKEPPRASVRISSLGATATTIAEQRQTDANGLHHTLQGDLDWVLLKALDKDRTRRYESASSFASDIRRYLASEPIEARSPTTAYRLSRYLRRNRIQVAVVALLISTLSLGLCGTLWQRNEAIRKSVDLEDKQVKLEEALNLVDAEKQNALGNLKELQDTVYTKFFYNALLDGIDETSIKQAALRPEQRNALLGLNAFYENRHREAIAFLKDVGNPATLAVESWCHIAQGDVISAGDTLERMRKLPARTAEDHLMLAQIYVWWRPEEAWQHIEAAAHETDTGIIGQFVRALASTNVALHTNNDELAREAAGIVEAVNVLYPNNKFVLDELVFVYGATAMINRGKENAEVAEQFFLLANRAAEDFLKREAIPSGFHAVLLSHQGRYQESLAILETILLERNFYSMEYVLIACLADERARAFEFLHGLDQDDYITKIGLAFLYANDPAFQARVPELVTNIFDAYPGSDFRFFALQALLMAGVDDHEVAHLAMTSLDTTVELLCPLELIEVLAKTTPAQENEIINIKQGSVRSRAAFATGLRHYSRGDFEKATRLFDSVSEGSGFHHCALWAKYLAKNASATKSGK